MTTSPCCSSKTRFPYSLPLRGGQVPAADRRERGPPGSQAGAQTTEVCTGLETAAFPSLASLPCLPDLPRGECRQGCSSRRNCGRCHRLGFCRLPVLRLGGLSSLRRSVRGNQAPTLLPASDVCRVRSAQRVRSHHAGPRLRMTPSSSVMPAGRHWQQIAKSGAHAPAWFGSCLRASGLFELRVLRSVPQFGVHPREREHTDRSHERRERALVSAHEDGSIRGASSGPRPGHRGGRGWTTWWSWWFVLRRRPG